MSETRLSDLRYKEVIDLTSGQRLGVVRDLVFDPESGRVQALIVPGRLRWLGLLGRETETVIPWEKLQRLGEDIIFINP